MVMVQRNCFRIIFTLHTMLPNNIAKEIFATEHLIHDDFQIMRLIIVNRYPNASVFRQQFA